MGAGGQFWKLPLILMRSHPNDGFESAHVRLDQFHSILFQLQSKWKTSLMCI